MGSRTTLLGTGAALGALLASAAPGSTLAQERPGPATVVPGGALEVSISGFARFRAHGGQLDNSRLDGDLTQGLDFSNDTEAHVILRGEDDTTGLEYGGTVEFESDTNREDNTDETWIFVSGGFGELRFGDDDGVLENSGIGGYTIAAGTGGYDGSVIDAIGTPMVRPTSSDDATKLVYYTPSFAGLGLALSYTPNQDDAGAGTTNGDDLAARDVEAGDIVEGGLVYAGTVGGFGLTASALGIHGDIKDEDLDGDGVDDASDGDDYWGIQAGAAISLFGFELAGGWFTDHIGDSEKNVINGGVGAALGPANVSLTAAYTYSSDDLTSGDNELDKPMIVVLSADYGLAPGLVLAGDVSYFDNDVTAEADDGSFPGDDKGIAYVLRVGLAF
jgi:outer membrane protein OmpU